MMHKVICVREDEPKLIKAEDMERGTIAKISSATMYLEYTNHFIMKTYDGWMILSDPGTGFWSRGSTPPFMVRVLKKGEQITITIGEES